MCWVHIIEYYSPIKRDNVLNNIDESHRYSDKYKKVHTIWFHLHDVLKGMKPMQGGKNIRIETGGVRRWVMTGKGHNGTFHREVIYYDKSVG